MGTTPEEVLSYWVPEGFAEAEPDLEVPDLESLVHALGVRGS